ncbi:MAG: hypothetical protein J5787_05390 [Alphaproteobacteria bacterium]|nr:hypothetical protein [Alphaproteobacteria bacterium]MBO4643944.1 hypothetical protein [Alphaproteobacteria bacterium]
MGFLSDLFKGLRNIQSAKQEEKEQPFDWRKEQGDSLSYGTGFSFANKKEFEGWRRIKPQEGDAEFIADRMKDYSLRALHLSSDWSKTPEETKVLSTVCAALPDSHIKELTLNGDLTAEQKAAFFEALPKMHLQKLSVDFRMTPEEAEKFGQAISKLPLQTLRLRNSYNEEESVLPVLKRLPVSLEHLDLSGCTNCTDESMAEIARYIGRTNLRSVDMTQTQITDKYIPEIMEKAKNPDLPPIMIQTIWTKVSNQEAVDAEFQYHRNQKKILDIRTAQMGWITHRYVVMNDGVSLGDARAKPEVMRDYALAGRLTDVMDRANKVGRPLTTEELTTQASEYARTPLQIAAVRHELDKVFDPKHWTNAQEMQKAWDSLKNNPKYAIQMDGKDGRPSFEENKKAVERNSLVALKTQALAAKRDR